MNDPLGLIAIFIGGTFFTVIVLRQVRAIRNRVAREELAKEKLSAVEWETLGKKARIVKNAPLEVREKLEGIIEVLMAEKNFEACGGLEEVTDEMKFVVMAQAALLLVGREHDYFPLLKSVLFYPDAYQATGHDGEEQTRLGESWSSGSIILSWKSVVKGGEDPGDGRNVVLHEFSHQLDQENEASSGVPILEERADYQEWAAAFGPAYDEFTARVDAGKRTVLDKYGATSPAEFFSVGTETFFEKGKQLRKRYPELYAQMKEYYGLDPAEW
ncbi:zinc-dependent peptidase [bacterium]|nr:zinc-dependent peptidase [bacterium]